MGRCSIKKALEARHQVLGKVRDFLLRHILSGLLNHIHVYCLKKIVACDSIYASNVVVILYPFF